MKKYTKAIQEVIIIPQAAGTIVTECPDWYCDSVQPCQPCSAVSCDDVYDCTPEYSGVTCTKYHKDAGCSDVFDCCHVCYYCYYYCG